MLNKIDKTILQSINILNNSDNCFDVIVQTYNYEKTLKLLEKNYNQQSILKLPIISSFAMKINVNDIVKIASYNSVKFISKDTRVCCLIYNSKKIIGVNEFSSMINKNYNHSCVIIDTGVYPHIDFDLGQNRIIKFIDLINNRDCLYDDNGHGTFVVGVLSGNSICSKYSGIDNNCNIIVIKALDSEGMTNSIKILEAMQWILDNKNKYDIKIVCMSFGSVFGNVDDPLINGVEVLWDNGIVVVSAGGNSGPEDSSIMSPGASKKIITVGSLDKCDDGENFMVADFSSRGPINNSYKPDLVVPGVDIISTNVFSKDKKFYTTMSGTSVSAPMVAGVVSLLFKFNPNYTPDQIKYMLINSCDIINGDRNVEGYGVLNLHKIRLI